MVVYFPGGAATTLKNSENLAELNYIDFIARSGRALLYPIYKGTYERGGGSWPQGKLAIRDWYIMIGKDIRRSIDYLQSRDDIDSSKIGYFGLSWGAVEGPIFTAIENRFQAAVFMGGGLSAWRMRRPPEINPLNFAPRVKTSVLLISGRHEFIFPPKTSSGVLFRLLGSTKKNKRHALLNGGHIPPWNEVVRETLDWLDLYLGKVKK